MSARLTPTAVYGKVPGGSEFALRPHSGEAVPAALAAVAGDWLGLFLQGGNRAVSAVQRIGDRWWLFRVEADPHPDSSGRPTGFVLVAGLPDLVAESVPGVLVTAVQTPVSRDAPPESLPVAALTPTRTPPSATVALALASGIPVVAVAGFEEAATVMASGAPVEWVAFLPDRCQSVMANGPGLVVSRDRATFPAEMARQLERFSPEAVFALPLAELAGAESTPARRLKLALAALGDPAAASGMEVEPAAAAWLATTPHGRSVALPRLTPAAVRWWLDSRFARAEDLSVIADRLGAEHRPSVARLLTGHPTAADDYLRLFPDDAAGAVGLLSDADRTTWARLADPSTGAVEATSADQLLSAFDGSRRTTAFDLGQLAVAVAAGSQLAVPPFVAAAEVAGLAPDIATALLTGSPVAAVGQPPVLRPRSDWLVAIRPAHWLAAGDSFNAPDWRTWWRDGVEVLFRDGRVSSADVLGLGARTGDEHLLRSAGAPESLVRFLRRTGSFPLPPTDGPWPSEVNPRLSADFTDGSLFARVTGPVGLDGFDWLAARGVGFARAAEVAEALRSGRPADARVMIAAAGVLARDLVLRQVAAWGAERPGARRTAVLSALLGAPCLGAEIAGWLQSLLLRCEPLPACPPFAVADLELLLPVLDPVRDVIRAVLPRPDRDPDESRLLAALLPRLSSATTTPGSFPEVASRIRPDWVAALTAVPGWEGVAGPAADFQALAVAARAVQARWGDELPDSIRRAIALLTEVLPE